MGDGGVEVDYRKTIIGIWRNKVEFPPISR